ncbi:putative leucine-rich repeat receptor-like serine/threonine-protein kinase At2g24130 [Hordeum vulgare subsp. vulgare]|uniref:putative leucine-rich repeat receptor-like serine/threonine-protein kinase At2g24130 n=1 Tax=Hordeum vulgare subsp. vulgare TaxID=112509 RepID=UPI001D1A44A1|nr:putative leucine-rich repeat receptor-like serine/threonine-protein kinase At2g24130 [Hordeum vulgare subsp. vulgare]
MVARPITAIIFTFLLFFLFLHTASPALVGEDEDRSVLLVFKASVSGDPKGALAGWGSPDVCNWTGVACDMKATRRRVVKLILSEQELFGEVSPALGNLSHLRTLNLSGNHFAGSIPPELGNLSYLKFLDVSLNMLNGSIPPELGNLSHLKFLDVSSNMLAWTIPPELGNLSRLKFLDVSSNTLAGTVPPELGNLSRLSSLDLSGNVFNDFVGAVPWELGKLSRLKQLSLSGNQLEGSIPVELALMRSLAYLNLGRNNLSGNIPSTIFCNLSALHYVEMSSNSLNGKIPIRADCSLPKLTSLVLWSNNLHGGIPPALSNSTNLRWLLLQSNYLDGELPSNDMFSGMRSLKYLHLSFNSLSAANSRNNTGLEPFFASLTNCTGLKELGVAGNDIADRIPSVVGRLPPGLMQLHLEFNRIFGPIPANIFNLTNLNLLNLSHNLLDGSIPQGIASMRQLEQLHLSNNLLSGDIPPYLGTIPRLGFIDFSQNQLTGAIPPSIMQCVTLQNLDLSHNKLQGKIPDSLSRMSGLLYLNLAGNLLSGAIPMTIGEVVKLEMLNLSSNHLSGTIPPQLSTCIELVYLDVSCNGLTGPLPLSLEKAVSLRHVNFSYNDFSGEVPSGGVFAGFRADAFLGNAGLCARTKSMTPPLARCNGAASHRRVVLLVVVTATSFMLAIIGLTVLDANTGGGEVCRSFKRECDVLRQTRHRNLVRVVTTCSQPDFHAIVLPLMANGSLESHLYPRVGGPGRGMDLAWLVSIAGDIAEGLTYLHHYAPVRVVHCDLKPSNVLLDDDMTAVVADFGIARMVKDIGDDDNNTGSADPCNSTAGLLQGSVGYIAPEYGLGGRSSREGDVYSFGVMLLELITGKRPTDVLFQGGLTLHDWVRRHHPHDVTDIIARSWLATTDEMLSAVQANNIVVKLMELGIACTQHSPMVRPTMVEVCHAIALLKDSFSS